MDDKEQPKEKPQRHYKAPTGDESLVSARRAAFDVTSQIGKVQLVPAGAAVGKRGRGAGFYCEACDLTFKDNKQFVDHQNTQQHLLNTGQTGKVHRATVEEVRERILFHIQRKKELEEEKKMSVDDRVQRSKMEMERQREENRQRRKEREEKKKQARQEEAKAKMGYGDDVRIEGEHDEDDMMAQMGITGFGTSKK